MDVSVEAKGNDALAYGNRRGRGDLGVDDVAGDLAEQLVEGHRRVGGANHRNHDADQCDAEESVRLAVVTHSHDSASTHADDGDEVDHHNKSEQRGEKNPDLTTTGRAACRDRVWRYG